SVAGKWLLMPSATDCRRSCNGRPRSPRNACVSQRQYWLSTGSSKCSWWRTARTRCGSALRPPAIVRAGSPGMSSESAKTKNVMSSSSGISASRRRRMYAPTEYRSPLLLDEHALEVGTALADRCLRRSADAIERVGEHPRLEDDGHFEAVGHDRVVD